MKKGAPLKVAGVIVRISPIRLNSWFRRNVNSTLLQLKLYLCFCYPMKMGNIFSKHRSPSSDILITIGSPGFPQANRGIVIIVAIGGQRTGKWSGRTGWWITIVLTGACRWHPSTKSTIASGTEGHSTRMDWKTVVDAKRLNQNHRMCSHGPRWRCSPKRELRNR